MHELPVTQHILEIACRHADGARITDVHLVVGQLSSIVDDSVQFYWNIISKDTPAEGARLHFRRIPAEMECAECGGRFGLNGRDFLCPHCGGGRVRVVSGEAFYVDSIEVETELPAQADPPPTGFS